MRKSFKNRLKRTAGDNYERDERTPLHAGFGFDLDSTRRRMIEPISSTRIGTAPCNRVPVDPMRLSLGQVSRRIQFGPQLLPEIEGLISDVDNTTVFEKEIRAD